MLFSSPALSEGVGEPRGDVVDVVLQSMYATFCQCLISCSSGYAEGDVSFGLISVPTLSPVNGPTAKTCFSLGTL